MLSKEQITRKLHTDLSLDDRFSFDDALKSWWTNFRDGGGMRLTDAGFKAMNTWDVEKYVFDISPKLSATPRQLITLDRKLTCPYYIEISKKPKLILFGSKQATMLAMYGDLEKFLKFLDRE